MKLLDRPESIVFPLLCMFLFASCDEPIYTPKPRAYPKVIYPEKSYQKFDENYCSFTFEYPEYALVEQDTSFFDELPADPCWFNISIPVFNARLHCSYSPVSPNLTVDKLRADAFKMTEWHNKKATYIEDRPFKKDNNVQGILFNVEGPAASPVQFFVTDTLEQEHFLRCALYFYTQSKPDSLAPIVDFVKADIGHMIKTFEWKD